MSKGPEAPCPRCDGDGALHVPSVPLGIGNVTQCPACHGTGKVMVPAEWGRSTMPCSACDGTGPHRHPPCQSRATTFDISALVRVPNAGSQCRRLLRRRTGLTFLTRQSRTQRLRRNRPRTSVHCASIHTVKLILTVQPALRVRRSS